MTGQAQTWPWERMARSNAGSHELLVSVLSPQPGERWLDVGTGSGGVALLAARAGAEVTGVDVAPGAIELAKSHGVGEFLVADAQDLPFPDASFDVVVSAFGVIFAPDHEAAARELARVCRPGGRLGLTLMPPDSQMAALTTLLRSYGAEGDHPAAWAERVDDVLGPWFDVEARRLESPAEDEPPPAEAWEFMRTSFGPVTSLVERLDEDAVAALRERFFAIRERFEGKPRSYLLVLGTRR